jgi:hypothetical protein
MSIKRTVFWTQIICIFIDYISNEKLGKISLISCGNIIHYH